MEAVKLISITELTPKKQGEIINMWRDYAPDKLNAVKWAELSIKYPFTRAELLTIGIPEEQIKPKESILAVVISESGEADRVVEKDSALNTQIQSTQHKTTPNYIPEPGGDSEVFFEDGINPADMAAFADKLLQPESDLSGVTGAEMYQVTKRNTPQRREMGRNLIRTSIN